MRILALLLMNLLWATAVFAQGMPSRLENSEYSMIYASDANPFAGDGFGSPIRTSAQTIVERHPDGVIKKRAVFEEYGEPLLLYFAEHDPAGVVSHYTPMALQNAAYGRQARIAKLKALLRASGHTGALHFESKNEFRQFALSKINFDDRTLRFFYSHKRFVRWFRHLGMKYRIIDEHIDGAECDVAFAVDFTIESIECDNSPNTNSVRREMYEKTLRDWEVLDSISFRRLTFGEDNIPAFGVVVVPGKHAVEHRHIGPFPIPPEPAFLLLSRSKWIKR